VDISGKLQIKPGQSVVVLNAPPGLDLPGVRPAADAAAADADVVLAFVTRAGDLSSAAQAIAAAQADRLAWISYPKAGQLGTDLNRDRLVAALSGQGVQPVRQISLDGTWSALRFRPASS
jgi:phage-related baseplate assembly protein